MTSPRDRWFEATVTNGGASGAAAIDIATRQVVAGFAHGDLASPALLDLLLGGAAPQGALTSACGPRPASAARELMVTGSGRALYCVVLAHGEVVVLGAPATMSVALGWALVRALVAGDRGR